MPTTSPSRRTVHLRLFATAALLVASAAAYAALAKGGHGGEFADGDRSGPPAFGAVVADGWRYEFHAVTGRERLVRIADGPTAENLVAEEQEVAERMRTSLAHHMGLNSLDELREAHRDATERLRALGYL